MSKFTVSECARRAGTTAHTVRYYDRIGLVSTPQRSDTGYRLYAEEDVERLRFIKRAQRLGLNLDEIRELLHTRDRGLCPCGHVREFVASHLQHVETQIAELARLRDDMRHLLEVGSLESPDGSCWPCIPDSSPGG